MRLLPAVALILAAASPASAQAARSYPYELGVDGSVIWRSTKFGASGASTTFTSVNLPVNAIRVGTFITNQLELEPSISYQRVSDSGNSFSQLDLSIAAPIYFTPDRNKTQLFVRPVVGLLKVSGDNGTQVNVGAGLGVKVPIDPRIATRFEAEYRHANESGNLGAYNQLGLIVGFSVYTR